MSLRIIIIIINVETLLLDLHKIHTKHAVDLRLQSLSE